MNLLQAYSLLNTINEGGADYQEEYREYIIAHKERVKQFANWLEENIPSLFDDEAYRDAFYEIIEEHDDSKFSEEEFEPYAKKWHGEGKNNKDYYDPEYERAWEHHWLNNEHHPEHWLGEDMPYVYILEMICDWGSFSIEKKDFQELIDYYYNEAKDDEEKNLSDGTKEIIEDILDKISSKINSDDQLTESFDDISLEEVDSNIGSAFYNIYSDGLLVGKVGFSFYEDIKALGIGSFEIDSKYRGQGIGTAVINYIIDNYKNSYDLIYCYVDKDNTGAINLYKRLGKVYDNDDDNNDYYYVVFYQKGGND